MGRGKSEGEREVALDLVKRMASAVKYVVGKQKSGDTEMRGGDENLKREQEKEGNGRFIEEQLLFWQNKTSCSEIDL